MFFDFIIFVLVGLLGAEVDAQCTGNSRDITGATFVSIRSSCSAYDASFTRSITGRTFSFLPKYFSTSVSSGFQCSFYNGTSTSDQLLGTIGDSLAGLVELFQNSANAFVRCVGTGTQLDVTSAFVGFLTVPSSNVESEVFEDVPLIEVQSPSFPQNYPSDYVQETVIKSSRSTTYTVSFNSTFEISDDQLSVRIIRTIASILLACMCMLRHNCVCCF
ncbi:uncharacterized protein LOC143453237 [Clavelina lepadiformis]|uniref:uncharacterized protein LOC143453237 n=1 Tax=Clavelina lepadiformis TaxID=159417 RepID=UPI00404242EB